ncbi:ABC transporter G family member 37 [Nymphaea thermarum]|nr:ABC transporter G family member 37 [Nymphaea thermarum]
MTSILPMSLYMNHLSTLLGFVYLLKSILLRERLSYCKDQCLQLFVEEVMELVELTSLRESLVGLPGVNGLSTEQRKRLTIAVELVANPSIIFMDEPTSGLDARAAAIVMRAVRNTVDTGRTVVCTIHQPSIDIFEAFDELFLMKRGGQEIYVGPLGQKSCHLISYFEGIEGVSRIRERYNPATWMLEVTSEAQEDILSVDFAEIYRNSDLYQRNRALINELSSPPPGSKDLYFPTKHSQSFITQCMACLWKQHWSYWRNPSYTATLVAIERTVFYRERAAGMFSELPYAFGQVAIELPYALIQALVYGVIVYAMIGFEWTAAKFFWYIFFMYFTFLYFTFYGMMAVAVTPNHHIAAIISSAFYAIWNLFSGFVIARPSMPVWWRWYYWACPVAWTLNGLVTSQFGDVKSNLEVANSAATTTTVEGFIRAYFGFRHDFLDVVSIMVVGFAILFACTGGDIYRAGSFRRNGSSSIWRNSGDDAFSRSSRDGEDDEEALKWAALEKLPTYDRIRRGILSGVAGGVAEVDVRKLGFVERESLLDRLVRVAEEDNEKFLLRLKERVDRVGIDIPQIEVRFENLNVDAGVYVGSRGLPTLLNSVVNMLEGALSFLHVLPKNKKPLSILHNVSGIMKPKRSLDSQNFTSGVIICRMTLVLGPPSSGKTTLLLALAGRLDSSLKTSGRITYNGHGMKEFVPQRTSAYISQHDLHIGEMTVRETLAFSARCQGVGSRYDLLEELSRREKAANIKPDPDLDVFMKAMSLEGQKASAVTDYILKILGLDICADTMVGNEMFRGISGGQKKRVTTGEMLVGPARALFMDEISTGLDSSTTYQIVDSIRQFVHILGATVAISLLQPAPETYDLFDDIILLSDGHIVYHGPREHVLEFFESMGFRCPERKGVADFLQEVTSRNDQRQYWMHEEETYRFVPVKEFSEAFHSFHIGQKLDAKLSTPFDKSKSHPAALTNSKYGVSKLELLKACFSRELLLMKRNSFVYVFKMTQLTVIAFITMTLFLRTEMHRNTINDGGIFLGALFFGLITIMFNGFAELSMTIAKLPVFYKQRDLFFYPAWTYAIPAWITKIPISVAEACIWVFLTYYVVGFDPSAGRMFKQLLLLLAINQMSSGLFRLIASLGRDLIVANTFGSFALLVIIVLGGFILSRDNIKKWWIWGYWISPLMYGQTAVSVNEFLGNSWHQVLPNSTMSLGEAVLKARGMFSRGYWYWIGVGALFGYTLLFNGLFSAALAYLPRKFYNLYILVYVILMLLRNGGYALAAFGKSQAVISEEALKEKHANVTGENVKSDLSSRGRRTTEARSESVAEPVHNEKKGMVLPFTPLCITFDDIRYAVDMPQEMKARGVAEDKLELLKGISGTFRPGVLTALMGVSGAGKTTLMDVLAGRKTGGYITGSIKISGYPKKQETFARVSGYCEQNDIHSPHVTVYESLVYSAWLRLPPEVSSATRKLFVEEVMELVELTSLRESLVGLPGVNGLSTEQRKRLTIAVELVANPSIIFMDEPTSGLDARAAAIVMRTVRNTVDTGRTVVCTIHQPSIDIFEAFDELFLMKRGGQEIYAGPLGQNSCHLVSYFEGIEGVTRIRERYNPATWMLEVTSEAQEDILGVDFAEIYRNSDLYQRNRVLIQELSSPPPGSNDLYFPTKHSQSFITQCMACLWKQHWSYWRNPPYTATPIERTVFYREKAAGMYSALPYAFGQVVIELPYVLIQALVYGVIVYAMIGFEWTAAKFFWYIFFMYFTFLYFTFYGMMAVAVTPNHHIASIVSSAFYAIWNVFSGFVIPRPSMPVWWRWYYWACPVAWTLNGLVTSQFGDLKSNLEVASSAAATTTVEEFIRAYFGFHHDFLDVVAIMVAAFALRPSTLREDSISWMQVIENKLLRQLIKALK